MEKLEYWDEQLLLSINNAHNPILDGSMWWISTKVFWIPLYLFLIVLAYRVLSKKGFLYFLVFASIAVVFSDLISVHLFKNVFLRYRPSHHLYLSGKLHFHQMSDGTYYKGGVYGFISSHASNFMAVTMSSWLVLRKHFVWVAWLLFTCLVLVCVSRVYLGVHYPSDVLVGTMVGAIISTILYVGYFRKVIL